MELLKGYTASVQFVVPSTVQIARFIVQRDGAQVGAVKNATVSDGIATCDLPYEAVSEEGLLTVVLTFSIESKSYDVTQEFEVITPILPIHEVKAIINSTNDVEAKSVESAVRHIIQAHTGQSFGHYVGAEVVVGGGERILRLPRRLIKLNSLNGNTYWVGEAYIHTSQYYLVAHHPYWDGGIKSDFYGYQGEWLSDVPIYAPPMHPSLSFNSNVNYTLDGEWGWVSVPQAVQEAAKLLINDYACGDNVYRDRFVQIATGPDWRLEFNDGAYANTGNVRANQLLEQYVVKYGWEVV